MHLFPPNIHQKPSLVSTPQNPTSLFLSKFPNHHYQLEPNVKKNNIKMVLSSTINLHKPPFLQIHSSILSPPQSPSSSLTKFTLSSTTPLQASNFRAFPQSQTLFSNSIARNSELGYSRLSKIHMGKGYSRISAVSGDGSSGTPGGNGGGGFGGAGDDSGSGGNDSGNKSNWSLISWYMDLLARSPVLTKAVTSALLTLVGDLICQLAIDKVSSLDLKRTSIFTFLGLAFVGPTLHYWYLYLSKVVTLQGASGAFVRLLLDQFVFAPAFIATFLSILITLEGRPSQVIPKLQQEWFSSVLANWQLWIPFQFLNFRFVPQQFQVLASNFVAVVWNVVLSFKAHKAVVTK